MCSDGGTDGNDDDEDDVDYAEVTVLSGGTEHGGWTHDCAGGGSAAIRRGGLVATLEGGHGGLAGARGLVLPLRGYLGDCSSLGQSGGTLCGSMDGTDVCSAGDAARVGPLLRTVPAALDCPAGAVGLRVAARLLDARLGARLLLLSLRLVARGYTASGGDASAYPAVCLRKLPPDGGVLAQWLASATASVCVISLRAMSRHGGAVAIRACPASFRTCEASLLYSGTEVVGTRPRPNFANRARLCGSVPLSLVGVPGY